MRPHATADSALPSYGMWLTATIPLISFFLADASQSAQATYNRIITKSHKFCRSSHQIQDEDEFFMLQLLSKLKTHICALSTLQRFQIKSSSLSRPYAHFIRKPDNMHLILTGATGLVGSGVLDAMIKMKDVTKISVLSRRPVKMAKDAKDPRVNVIIHKDFEKYDSDLLSKLSGANGCVWALGISQTQVGKE